MENIPYFPLNDVIFSKVLLATQRLYEKLPDIKYSTLVYKGYIVFNEAPLDSVSILYNTLYHNIEMYSKFTNFSRPSYKILQTVFTGKEDSDNPFQGSNISNYRKCFELNNNNNFLMGLNKININNFNEFIPKLYIKSSNEKVKLVIYYYLDLMIILYFKESFNPQLKMNNLLKMEKWSKRYYDEIIPELENLHGQKLVKLDIHNYVYCNNNNRSIKIATSFFTKKNKVYSLDKDKFEFIVNFFKSNYLNKNSSLTKLKHTYVYFLNTLDRKIMILMSDNLSMQQMKNYIIEIKKEKFDTIFIL